MDAGPKDEQADDCGSDGGQQNSSRSDILGSADQRMKFLGRGVGKELESGIQCFRGPNGGNRQYNTAPFGGREMEVEARRKDRNSSQGMDPRVMLGSEQIGKASKGISKAADAAAELEGTVHCRRSGLIGAFAPRWSALVHCWSMNPEGNCCPLRLARTPQTARKRMWKQALDRGLAWP